MRFLSLSAPIFDVQSPTVLRAIGGQTSPINLSRRNTITATLDGGVVLEDGGYADGDRNLSFVFPGLLLTQHTQITRMIKSYSLIVISFYDGCYTLAPSSYTVSRGDGTLTGRIITKLSS